MGDAVAAYDLVKKSQVPLGTLFEVKAKSNNHPGRVVNGTVKV